MGKLFKWVLYFNLVLTFCHAAEKQFLENSISHETYAIMNTQQFDHEKLADLHTSRGESYMLLGNHKAAEYDFQVAQGHLRQSSEIGTIMGVGFRSFLGLAIVYDNLEQPEEFQKMVDSLQAIVSMDVSCMKTKSNFVPSIFKKSYKPFDGSFMIKRCEDDYVVYGPDRVSKEECEDFVFGLAKDMAKMVDECTTNKNNAQAILRVIDDLSNKALDCCRTSSFWKQCLNPIAAKRLQWKNSQTMFGKIDEGFINVY